jgi:hypothetical protein
MKTKILLALAALVLTVAALAQEPTVRIVGQLNGNTGAGPTVAATASSTTNTVPTSEYNAASLQLSLKCTASTSGNAIIRQYRSLDSSNFETTATTNLVALNGTTAVSGVVILPESYLSGVAALKLVIDNTNGTAILTNVNFRIRYNAPAVRFVGN